MLVLSRRDLAANLAAFGEAEASAMIAEMPERDYQRVCEVGFKLALDGKSFAKAASLAAIEVLEGGPRALRRSRRLWSDVPASLLEPDPRMLNIEDWFERYSGGEPVRKPEIMPHVAAHLGASIPNFRYVKTANQFRRPFPGGTTYIDLSTQRA